MSVRDQTESLSGIKWNGCPGWTGICNMYVFSRLSEVRDLTEKWLKEYNEERPHESLGNMTPVEYLESKQPETSILLRH